MAWTAFPYPDPRYRHTPASLQQDWPALHRGDGEPFPVQPALVQAWIALHAGEFERAARLGLDVGVNGYAVAHQAICLYNQHLETSARKRLAAFECVAERCERQQREQPDNPAGWYWHGYALGYYSSDISLLKALAQGLGARVRHSLETALRLAPQRADVHVALGAYHTEIVDKAGAVIAGLTHGARKEAGYGHFDTALRLDPQSTTARVGYARALRMLDGKRKLAQARTLLEPAAAVQAHDAVQRLQIDAARRELANLPNED
ncbi:hypothetical protein ASF61_18920 [Duganella sp. Leaf126]|uniref:hypothetical protein n=1 Tax=Duganella sp. Leaf126 TaxID=1736266 RepID=UPI0007010213|nr:hypothetical protein [Duganella sp. Leaf126]KQQ45746.1 hypothetical protein ASF61_18920 [Duganella sp. Leaf126]